MLSVPEMMNLNVTSAQNDSRCTIQKLTANSNSNSREMVSNAIASGDFTELSQNVDLRISRGLMRDSILSFKQNFNGCILRRTPASLKRDGETIIKLPPLNIVTAWIKLGEHHEKALMEVTEEESTK